jgi:hypothetical protein
MVYGMGLSYESALFFFNFLMYLKANYLRIISFKNSDYR